MTMKKADLRTAVIEELVEVVPEAEPGAIDDHESFRDQFEIDSVDFLTFVMNLEKRLGIHVPEYEYPRLASLSGAVEYLATHGAEEKA